MKASKYSDFPWDMRISGLNRGSTFIVTIWTSENFVGYLEIGEHWDNSNDLELSSIQIYPRYRKTFAFKKLLKEGFKYLTSKGPECDIYSHVQVSNIKMMTIFKRLGFSFSEGRSSHTMQVKGKLSEILDTDLYKLIMN
ncbi:hypothetical protein C0Z22_12910 [Halobacteriovorax sp. DA5]|nr:hypothetical protein C0Z22_12910 [Halobacteriovorax sp. DA5]